MKRSSADDSPRHASWLNTESADRRGSTLRATAPPFVPQQQPPHKMRRTETPDTAATAFGEARRLAVFEQALREEEEYQAWRAAELAAEGAPDDEEQA